MLYENSMNRALAFAKSEGFASVEYLQEWEGHDLFVATDDKDSYTGLPNYILVNSDLARWANPSEQRAILFA